MTKSFITIIPAIFGILVISLIVSVFRQTPIPTQGSVAIANEYYSTSTPHTGLASAKPILLREGSGSLGSVIITGAASGHIFLYDATTTDITKRTGGLATSTLVAFPQSAAAGTYTFDTFYKVGLILEMVGSLPTTTITWR